jgi:16S rRNA (cytosine967-C5)-methyltransferase
MLSDVAGDAAVIIAADRSPERLALAAENFRRAGRRIETRVADAVEPPFPKESFDLVFADVPCSNTGVARRRPDAPWRFSINVLEKLEKLQRRILLASADLVAPGGAIVYSTCSVEPDEGLMQVEFLLAKRPEFRLEKSGMHLPCLAHDGAFAALIVRR